MIFFDVYIRLKHTIISPPKYLNNNIWWQNWKHVQKKITYTQFFYKFIYITYNLRVKTNNNFKCCACSSQLVRLSWGRLPMSGTKESCSTAIWCKCHQTTPPYHFIPFIFSLQFYTSPLSSISWVLASPNWSCWFFPILILCFSFLLCFFNLWSSHPSEFDTASNNRELVKFPYWAGSDGKAGPCRNKRGPTT